MGRKSNPIAKISTKEGNDTASPDTKNSSETTVIANNVSVDKNDNPKRSRQTKPKSEKVATATTAKTTPLKSTEIPKEKPKVEKSKQNAISVPIKDNAKEKLNPKVKKAVVKSASPSKEEDKVANDKKESTIATKSRKRKISAS